LAKVDMPEQNEGNQQPLSRRQIVGRRVWSAIPILLSMAALIISFRSYRVTAIRNVKPVLVIAYANESGWQLRNVGNGPALNVLVAQRHETGDWFEPVRVPPLASGDELHLTWLQHTNIRWIGVTYNDVDGRVYSSECSDDLTKIRPG